MSTGKTQLGLEPNVNAVLCYMPVCCLGLVVSIVTVVVEKQNRFAKFHAFQSLLVWGASIVLTVALQIAMVLMSTLSGLLGTLVWALMMLVGVGLLGLTVLLMIKAYGNEQFELPVLGEMARKWSSQ